MEVVNLFNSWSPTTAADLLLVIVGQFLLVWLLGKLTPGLCNRLLKTIAPDEHEALIEDFIEPSRSIIVWTGTLILGNFFIFQTNGPTAAEGIQGLWWVLNLSRIIHFAIYHGLVGCTALLIAKAFSLWLKRSGTAITHRFDLHDKQDLKLIENVGHFCIGLFAAVIISQQYANLGMLIFAPLIIFAIATQGTTNQVMSAWLIRKDRPFKVGDTIRLTPRSSQGLELQGIIEKIGWASTRIHDLDRSEKVEVPNNEMYRQRFAIKS